MAKPAPAGAASKSSAIRAMLKEQPGIKPKELIDALKAKGVMVSKNLVYLVKGKTQGEQTRRRTVNRGAQAVARASSNADAVQTILKVKALAMEVGGYDALRALVDALSA